MRVDGVGGFRAQDVGLRMEDLIEILGFRIQGSPGNMLSPVAKKDPGYGVWGTGFGGRCIGDIQGYVGMCRVCKL